MDLVHPATACGPVPGDGPDPWRCLALRFSPPRRGDRTRLSGPARQGPSPSPGWSTASAARHTFQRASTTSRQPCAGCAGSAWAWAVRPSESGVSRREDTRRPSAPMNGTNERPDGTVGVTGRSSNVAAAVAWYPGTDFLAMSPDGTGWPDPSTPEALLIGGTTQERRQDAVFASPVSHVHPGERRSCSSTVSKTSPSPRSSVRCSMRLCRLSTLPASSSGSKVPGTSSSG